MIKSRIIKRVGHVEGRRKRRNGYGVYVGKPETQRPNGRPRRIWECEKGKAIPLQSLRVPEGSCFQISRESAHEGGKVVSPTYRPSLLPRNILVLNSKG
jgi:hypothetical protein